VDKVGGSQINKINHYSSKRLAQSLAQNEKSAQDVFSEHFNYMSQTIVTIIN
jgi:uncharacterized protein YnzC (UPF0291/DUF896 family)